MPTQENLPAPVPLVDPSALEMLLCRAGFAVAVLDGSGRLSMLSPGSEQLLQRPFAAVPAESLGGGLPSLQRGRRPPAPTL